MTQGETIEYSNGLWARVVEAHADGRFIIEAPEGFAACWRDLNATDGAWYFVNEASPFRATLGRAKLDVRAHRQ